MPAVRWQPSDRTEEARASVRAWIAETAVTNVDAPIDLDASSATWPCEAADAIVCINMLHIAPWSAALGLFAGAARLLGAGGLLVIYGPFSIDRVHTADSNAAFDARLRGEDPSWGVRDLTDVVKAAAAHSLDLHQRIAMPANNFTLVFKKKKKKK